jgi:nicotinate-nucleotide adenylyltransferase
MTASSTRCAEGPDTSTEPDTNTRTAETRVGWLGGSFDPVHEGHLFIAQAAADRFGLSRVLLIPAAQPPHKPDRVLLPGAQRLQLLELACAGDERLEPCDIELVRDGPSYSYDTARQLLELLPAGTRLHFILGADMLADLPNWFRVAELCELVTFCAVTRPGTALDPAPLARVAGEAAAEQVRRHLLEVTPHPASSTAIREAFRLGRAPEFVPAPALAEIERRGLYGAGGASSNDTTGS